MTMEKKRISKTVVLAGIGKDVSRGVLDAIKSNEMRQKQIDKMANFLFTEVEAYDLYREGECIALAKDLYEAGYRKQSEVIDEFVERLKKESFPEDGCGLSCVYVSDIDRIANEMKGE